MDAEAEILRLDNGWNEAYGGVARQAIVRYPADYKGQQHDYRKATRGITACGDQLRRG